MATVIPKIGTSGNVIEYISVLDPSDFYFFSTGDYATYNTVLQHMHVGRLDQVEAQLREDRAHLLLPLAESIWHSLEVKEPAWWKRLSPEDKKIHIHRVMDRSQWTHWKLSVDTKGTYELVVGVPWAELPKLMGTDLWRPAFINVKIDWSTLWIPEMLANPLA